MPPKNAFERPGWQTSEFWLSVVSIVCATALRVTHDIDADAWMVVVTGSTLGYAASRGIAKR